MTGIFLSFVEENKAVADYLYKLFKANGLQVWYCKESVPPGAYWRDHVRKAIQEGAKFVPVYSRDWQARESSVANEELAFAIGEIRKRIGTEWFVPISIDGTMLPDHEIYPGRTLRDIHCENLQAGWKRGLERVLRALGSSSPRVEIGEPLAPGIPSVVRFRNGVLRYKGCNPPSQIADGLIVTIKDGWCRREPNGSVLVRVESFMPNEKLDRLNRATGLDAYFLASESAEISTDPQHPTTFVGKARQHIPAGTPIYDMTTGVEQAAPSELTIHSEMSATGHLSEGLFLGSFKNNSMICSIGGNMPLSMWGSFEIELMRADDLPLEHIVQ